MLAPDEKRVQLLYETDHEALLQACRSLMEQKRNNSLNMNHWFIEQRFAKALRINGNFHAAGISETIVDLEPVFIKIYEDDRVLIELVSDFYSVAVQAYPDDVEGGGNKKLLDGLWYWDVGYEKISDFDEYLKRLKPKNSNGSANSDSNWEKRIKN